MTDKQIFQQQYQSTIKSIEVAMAQAGSLIAPTFPGDDIFRKEVERFTVHGGKRFRPVLSLVTAKAFGHTDVTPHLALEVFHKYLLAHDDIIDRDEKRYGMPTIHAKMAALHAGDAMAGHYGNSLAIIGGDLLAAATQKIILETDLPDARKISLQKLIVRAVEEVAWGWYDQFLMDYLPLDSDKLSVKRIEESTIWVTGRYSIKLPLMFGYVVADRRAPDRLEKLADLLGILYQTGDDIIGLFGREAVTGKSNYGDIVQGKKTLPMYIAYEQATPEDKKTLVELVGKNDITQAEVAEVRAILHRSDGLARTQELMRQYSSEATQYLNNLALPENLHRFLNGFIEYIISRDA